MTDSSAIVPLLEAVEGEGAGSNRGVQYLDYLSYHR